MPLGCQIKNARAQGVIPLPSFHRVYTMAAQSLEGNSYAFCKPCLNPARLAPVRPAEGAESLQEWCIPNMLITSILHPYESQTIETRSQHL